jgi:hypothetical protein
MENQEKPNSTVSAIQAIIYIAVIAFGLYAILF